MTDQAKERCATCRYSLPGEIINMFFCRRLPPMQFDIASGDWRQPIVCPADWCGEYKPKEQAE